MSRGKAIALGVFTAWPLVYVIVFVAIMFTDFVADFSGWGPGTDRPLMFRIIFPLHLLTMLELWGLLLIYILYLFRTDRVARDKKALWAVVLLLGNMVAMPVFWHLYIWRRPDRERPGPAASS